MRAPRHTYPPNRGTHKIYGLQIFVWLKTKPETMIKKNIKNANIRDLARAMRKKNALTQTKTFGKIANILLLSERVEAHWKVTTRQMFRYLLLLLRTKHVVAADGVFSSVLGCYCCCYRLLDTGLLAQ